jgi:N-acetyl-alpha-D-glucosaminyl L-malate synthase BshA
VNIGIVCHPTYGGSGVLATELAIELSKRGHNIHLICYKKPVRLDREYPNLTFHKAEPASYSLFPHPFYTLSLASRIYSIHKEINFDIVHLHYAIPHTPSALLARSMGANFSVITTLHGTDIQIMGVEPSYKEMVRFSLTASDRITAVSAYLVKETKRLFEIERDIDVIHNFVDTDLFSLSSDTTIREKYSEEKIVVHISNLRKVKNLSDLIKAFGIILSAVDSRLLIIGDGPERGLAERMSYEFGLSEKISFLGEVPDVVPFLKAANLFFTTSVMESFCLSALEAMSCGIPVVGYNVGGIAEVVTPECGFLAEVHNVREVAGLAVKLLSDDRLEKRMGEAGRRRAEERFSLKKMVSCYERLYFDLYK